MSVACQLCCQSRRELARSAHQAHTAWCLQRHDRLAVLYRQGMELEIAVLRRWGRMGEAMTADALVSRHTTDWRAATVHPFLAGVRDGSVPEDCFDRWLAQDYLFAQVLVRAQSRIAAAAPFADVGLLAGGVVATVGELGWFEQMAARRGVVLDAPMHPATRAYCDFLLALTYCGYPAQITAIWAVERTYLESWGAPARVRSPTASS